MMYLIFSCTVRSSRPLYGWMWKATCKSDRGGGYFQHCHIAFCALTPQRTLDLCWRASCHPWVPVNPFMAHAEHSGLLGEVRAFTISTKTSEK